MRGLTPNLPALLARFAPMKQKGEQRFERMEQKFDQLEQKNGQHFERLERKLDVGLWEAL